MWATFLVTRTAGLATIFAHVLIGPAFAVVVHAQAPTVRDSAGVRVVENGSRRAAPVAFRLGDRPLLSVGGLEADPDQEFTHNQGYLRGVSLSDGRLAVIDVWRLHFFAPDGKRLKIVGRQGRGPEEFLYLVSICRTRGDTLIVDDSHNRRVAVLAGDGTIVRTIPQGDHGSPPFDACFDDGTFVVQRSVGDVPAGGGARPLRLTRLRTDGTVVNVIGEFPTAAFDMVTMREESIAPAGTRLYYGSATTSEVQVFDVRGKLLEIVRSDDPPIRISDAEAEERMAGTIPRNVTASERTARLERMRAMRRATHWPAYGRIHVDPDGRLWVRDYQKDRTTPNAWTAFDSTGRMLGRLVIPVPPGDARSPQVIGFGRGSILVRRYDADRASHLTLYPVVPR